MNTFGLNSAPLNGSVARYVLGAALFAGQGALSATPTRTTFVDQAVASVSSSLQAQGVRTVLGAANAATVSTLGADGVIAITSGATSRATSSMTATYTAVYCTIQSSFTADATKVVGAAASSTATSSLGAIGARSAGVQATATITSSLQVDPSVKRSGQSTTEREGYAQITASGTFYADGLKTALALASSQSTSQFANTAVVTIHGGRAVAAGTSAMTALGAIDNCYLTGTSNFTAVAGIIQSAAATFACNLNLTATHAAMTFPAVAPMAATSMCTANARLGILAAASAAGSSLFTASGRLAEQSAASFTASSDVSAAPWVYVHSQATADMRSLLTAEGMKVKFAAATIQAGSGLTAIAIANPNTPAPLSRSMRLRAQDRSMRVPFEDRTMRVT